MKRVRREKFVGSASQASKIAENARQNLHRKQRRHPPPSPDRLPDRDTEPRFARLRLSAAGHHSRLRLSAAGHHSRFRLLNQPFLRRCQTGAAVRREGHRLARLQGAAASRPPRPPVWKREAAFARRQSDPAGLSRAEDTPSRRHGHAPRLLSSRPFPQCAPPAANRTPPRCASAPAMRRPGNPSAPRPGLRQAQQYAKRRAANGAIAPTPPAPQNCSSTQKGEQQTALRRVQQGRVFRPHLRQTQRKGRVNRPSVRRREIVPPHFQQGPDRRRSALAGDLRVLRQVTSLFLAQQRTDNSA